jgi:hypothetical protein
LDPCAVDAAQVAVAETALTAEAYAAAAVQTVARDAVRSSSAATALPVLREPGVLDVVPLSVATGYVRVYFTAL